MKSIRKFSLPRSLMLTLLAACLTAGLASAQNFKGQSTAPSDTHGAMATLPAAVHPFTLAGVGLNIEPPSPCLEPPEPCSRWAWARSVLHTLEGLL
jgi:hypothetical protein